MRWLASEIGLLLDLFCTFIQNLTIYQVFILLPHFRLMNEVENKFDPLSVVSDESGYDIQKPFLFKILFPDTNTIIGAHSRKYTLL